MNARAWQRFSLISLLALGCHGSDTPVREERQSLLEENERRVADLFEHANVFVEYSNSAAGPQFVVRTPALADDSEFSGPLTRARLLGFLTGIQPKELALVQLEKKMGAWPDAELDRIERTLSTAGFGRVVICQATGMAGSPILRGTEDGVAPE